MMPNSVNKRAMNQSMTTSHGFTNEDKSWTTRASNGNCPEGHLYTVKRSSNQGRFPGRCVDQEVLTDAPPMILGNITVEQPSGLCPKVV